MKEIKEGKEIGIYKVFFIRLFSRNSNKIFLIIQNCLLLLFLLNSSLFEKFREIFLHGTIFHIARGKSIRGVFVRDKGW